MTPHRCWGPDCTASLRGRRRGTRYCSDACRARAWKAGTEQNGENGGSEASGGPGVRPATLYTVERAENDVWRPVGQIEAHDGIAAIRALADDELELYRAIPGGNITAATGAGDRFPPLISA